MAMGLVGALFVTRVLRTLLYGIKLTDITTFFVVCAILGAAAFSACSCGAPPVWTRCPR